MVYLSVSNVIDNQPIDLSTNEEIWFRTKVTKLPHAIEYSYKRSPRQTSLISHGPHKIPADGL
jgi:hypothetical protein